MTFNTSVELVLGKIEPEVIPIAVVPSILTLLTIAANFTVVIVIVGDRKLFKKHSSILIINLAIADLVVGAVVMPLAVMMIITKGHWSLGNYICRFWTSMDVIASTASIVTLCVISMQRLHAITNPLACVTSHSRHKIYISVLCIWTYSVCVLLVCIKWKRSPDADENPRCFVGDELEHLLVSVLLSFYLPLLVIIVVSCRITQVIHQRKNKLTFAAGSRRSTKRCILRVHVGKGDGLNVRHQFLLKQQYRTYRTLAYVMLIFVLCWLPFFIAYPVRHIFPDTIPTEYIDFFTWLGYSNSICNVVIYAVKMKDFARAFRKVSRCIFCLNRAPQ